MGLLEPSVCRSHVCDAVQGVLLSLYMGMDNALCWARGPTPALMFWDGWEDRLGKGTFYRDRSSCYLHFMLIINIRDCEGRTTDMEKSIPQRVSTRIFTRSSFCNELLHITTRVLWKGKAGDQQQQEDGEGKPQLYISLQPKSCLHSQRDAHNTSSLALPQLGCTLR